MAIKEPGHSLIMIRRVRAHDRGLCVPVCVCYMYININLRDVGVEFEQECGLCTCVSVYTFNCVFMCNCKDAGVMSEVLSTVRSVSIWTIAGATNTSLQWILNQIITMRLKFFSFNSRGLTQVFH